LQSNFLNHFTGQCSFCRFVQINEATRQAELTLAWITCSSQEQDSSLGIDNDSADCDGGAKKVLEATVGTG